MVYQEGVLPSPRLLSSSIRCKASTDCAEAWEGTYSRVSATGNHRIAQGDPSREEWMGKTGKRGEGLKVC